MRLGLLQYAIDKIAGPVEFAEKIDRLIADGAAGGGELLVLPEYACVEAGACPSPDLAGELERTVGATDALLEALRGAAIRSKVWLIGGSLPVRVGAEIHNRAPLIAPDGRIGFQDKHVMTRFESELWGVSSGAPPGVFETPWGLIGISICYDVEFPALVRAQVEAGAWLVLAPSCTDTMAGFHRVRLSARARALENQCFVGIAPTVGAAPWLGTLDQNHGYAAVFGPVDRGFPDDGVLARGVLDAAQWVFADLDPARLDAVRCDGGVRNFRDWPAHPPAARIIGLS